MTHQDPPEENIVPPFEIAVGETESFPANWVAFYGDFETDGVWSAGGMCCLADALPIPVALQQAIGEWGTQYYSKAYAKRHGWSDGNETFFQWFDQRGMSLARQVKSHLPHWIVTFHSEFGVYSTPKGKSIGAITVDGSFADLTQEELSLREAILNTDYLT